MARKTTTILFLILAGLAIFCSGCELVQKTDKWMQENLW